MFLARNNWRGLLAPLYLLMVVMFVAHPVHAKEVPLAPENYLLDEANLFSDIFESNLILQLYELEQETSAEIGVLTVTSLEGDSIEMYANEVFREWGIGQAELDNGVLLLIALEDREMRIEVGYGLEGRITDADASWIIRNTLVPAFQAEDFESGVSGAIDELRLEILAEAEEYYDDYYDVDFEYEPVPLITTNDPIQQAIGAAFFGFLILLFTLFIMAFIPIKRRKNVQKLPIVSVVLMIFFIFAGAKLLAFVFGIIAGLIYDSIIRNLKMDEWTGGGGSGGSWGGFSGGGSSGGGGFSSGGGGFSGGGFSGGSSGGGGSSGSW